MGAPTAFGTLGTFPREIRDTIYSHLLSTTYVAASQSHEQRAITRLAILHTSKVISEEAVKVLYSQGNFRFVPDFRNDGSLLELNQKATSLMKNIEIVIHIPTWVTCLHEPRLDTARKLAMETQSSSFLAHFGGDTVLRHSCRIKFVDTLRTYQEHLLSSQDKLFSTPLFQSFKELRGFKSVVVEVQSMYMDQQSWVQMYALYDQREEDLAWYHALPPIPCAKMEEYADSKSFDMHIGPAEDFHRQVERALEPTLGVGVEGPIPDTYNIVYARYSEFKPPAQEANVV